MIKYSKNSWYYSDGTKIEFKYHSPPPSLWKSLDGIVRLIDYDDKNDANQLVQKLERILYGK